MCSYRFPIIAREGWLLIGLFLIVGALGYYFSQYAVAVLFWLASAVMLWLYRDPQRKIPASPLAVVSPVDGRITAVSEVRDDYVQREAKRIAIAMPLTGVYSIRNPVEGKMMEQWFGETAKSIPSACNGPIHAQWLQTDEKDDAVMLFTRNRVNRLPRLYARSGERVGQGQRCGFVPLGTVVELLVPDSARIDVAIGERVWAGSSIIATFVH